MRQRTLETLVFGLSILAVTETLVLTKNYSSAYGGERIPSLPEQARATELNAGPERRPAALDPLPVQWKEDDRRFEVIFGLTEPGHCPVQVSVNDHWLSLECKESSSRIPRAKDLEETVNLPRSINTAHYRIQEDQNRLKVTFLKSESQV